MKLYSPQGLSLLHSSTSNVLYLHSSPPKVGGGSVQLLDRLRVAIGPGNLVAQVCEQADQLPHWLQAPSRTIKRDNILIKLS